MGTYEEIQKQIRQESLRERLEKSRAIIGKLCSEHRSPKMSIPLSATDEDIYVSTAIQDAIGVCEQHDLEREREEQAETRWQHYEQS